MSNHVRTIEEIAQAARMDSQQPEQTKERQFSYSLALNLKNKERKKIQMWNQIVYRKPTSLKELQDLCFCDLMMLRFRKVFKENKISFSDKEFAKSVLFDWFIQNAAQVGTTTRQGQPIKRGLMKDLPAKTYVTSIYKSLNRVKNFLKCENRWAPTNEQYQALARKLGYMDDDEIAKLEAGKRQHPEAYNKNFKVKRMYDLLPHLKFGGSRIGLLESAGYFQKVGTVNNISFRPTGKALKSPRVQMWEKYKADQNEQYAKLQKEASRNQRESAIDKVKNRFNNLKKFFNTKNYEEKYNKKEGENI